MSSTWRRVWITLASGVASAFAPAAAGAQGSASANSGVRAGGGALVGYTRSGALAEREWEARVIARPDAASADSMSRALSREPHVAGTPAQARTRDFVLNVMRDWGLATDVRSYEVYLPAPRAVHVWYLGSAARPDSADLSLVEGPVPGDTTSSAYPQVPTFNAFSATGNAAGDLVYANYGLIEDYAHLDSVGVSVAGKVVVARYGRSFRGIKAREAERHGAVALLIYSDPSDDGYARGDVYPDGPMRPEQGVQRGSVLDGAGDPSTPGYPSVAGAPRLAAAAMNIPHIPIVPISYRNASRLLRELRGDGHRAAGHAGSMADSAASLPQPWQGGLPFRYHVGPGPTRARVAFEGEVGPAAYHTIWDTFGVLRGTEYPNEMVIIGAHRDAWGPGASDNVSGVVTVLEIAHALAEEVRAGHRPKRTIVLATWDAEEWGIMGSTEYVEADSLRLSRDGVAYFNIDVAAEGPDFGSTASPSLRSTMRDVTKLVSDPEGSAGVSVFDRWAANNAARAGADDGAGGGGGGGGGPEFGNPGGGSDFAGFADHLGMPIIEWGFGGPGGVYHSAYDDYGWVSRFGDPGYRRHAAAARIGAALALRVADADLLPFDYAEHARAMRRALVRVDEAATGRGWHTSTARLATAIDDMGHAATAWTAVRDSVLGEKAVEHGAAARAHFAAANAALRRVDRAFTRPSGLKGRPWYRNLLFAPDENDGYADLLFPSVIEAVRANDADLAAREIEDLAGRFGAASAALRDAAVAVRARSGGR